LDTDLFNAHAFTETRLNEKVLVTTGYSFTTLDTDISGSCIYGADYDPIYDPLFARRLQRDEGFFGLTGGAQVKQHVGNFNLMLTPWSGWAIVPSVRVEKQDLDGVAEFIETNVGAGPAFAASAADLLNMRERGFLDVSQSLEARYTGLTNWTFYALAELLEGEGDLMEREIEAKTGVVDLVRDTDSTRFTQKYVAGANWYPARRLNMGAQYYHKIRENSYDHLIDTPATNAPPSSNRYPAFFRDQNFETDDVNVRVTMRPLDNVTLISRYDFQLSTIETIGDYLNPVQSAEARSHILSQSVTWTPVPRLYLQGSLNYVWDKTQSPTALSVPRTNLVQNVDNSYWNASAAAGYALTDKTDLQAQYFYHRADNFEDNSQFSQPYGVGAEEHGVTAAIIHRIWKNLVSTVKYGYFRNDDETSGGHNNYEPHLVYSILRYWF
jgi:hypothetical protein